VIEQIIKVASVYSLVLQSFAVIYPVALSSNGNDQVSRINDRVTTTLWAGQTAKNVMNNRQPSLIFTGTHKVTHTHTHTRTGSHPKGKELCFVTPSFLGPRDCVCACGQTQLCAESVWNSVVLIVGVEGDFFQ
jgi:hypothetical protein